MCVTTPLSIESYVGLYREIVSRVPHEWLSALEAVAVIKR